MSKKKLKKKKDKLLKKLKQQEEEFDRERDGMGDGNFVPFADKIFDDALLEQRDFFDDLSAEEQKVAIKILSEFKDEIVGGKTNALDYLWEIDYKWRPVDIEVFLNDEYYAGLITEDLYSTWRQHLLDVCAPDCNVYEMILCLSGDTKVPLLNGGTQTLKELHRYWKEDKEPFWVYSINKEGEVVPGKCTRVTKFAKDQLYKVTLDDGSSFRANSAHEMVMRDGTKKMVKDLDNGDRLMPFTTNIRTQAGAIEGYEQVYLPGKYKYAYTHRVVGKMLAGGTCPKTIDGEKASIHHKDFNKLNNEPDNLEWLKWSMHHWLHAKYKSPAHLKKIRERGKEITSDPNSALRKGHKKFMNSAAGRALAIKNLEKAQNLTPEERSERTRKGLKTRWENPEERKKAGKRCSKRSLGNQWGKLKADNSITVDAIYDAYLNCENLGDVYRELKISRNRVVRVLRDAGLTIEDLKNNYRNHKVVKIEKDEIERVYCLTVPEWGNFAIVTNDTRRGVFSGNTGAIGTGKTSMACLHMMYDLYKKSCLRAPQKFYSLMPGAAMVFGIYSVTRELVRDVGYTRLRSYIESSPYFSDKFPYKERIQRKIEFYDSPIEVMAGCVAEGTKIATPQGDVPIEKLVDSSALVLTSNGSKVFPSKYSGVKYSGVKKCLDLTTESGDNIVCSYDHKFTVEDSDGCLIQKKAEELREWETVFVLRKNEVRKTRIKSITDAGYRKTYDVVEVPETHNVFTNNILTSNSKAFHALGKDLHSFLMDEVNFMQTAKLKHGVRLADVSQAYKIYNAAQTRAKSRYMDEGGMVYLISSRTTRTSFLEQHVKEVKEEVKKKHVVIFDYALWDVNKDRVKYKKPKFRVEIGDAVHPSRIIPDDVEPRVGAETIEVPGEFELQFKRDIDQSLRDIAGIATYALMPFFRDRRALYACIDKDREHPFTREAVTLNILDDLTLNEFFKVEHIFRVSESMYVPKVRPYARRFAHIDIGLTQDAAGIAIGHVADMKEVKRMRQDGTFYWDRVPEIYIDLMIRINAPTSGEIDIAKLRAFIISLTDMGLPITSVTADGYQSRDMIQIFKKLGYPNAGILSVDRTVEPYMHLKQAIVENRLSYYHYKPVLLELSDLEHDTEIDKIDHPHTNSEGGHGSKDIADCLSGIVHSIMLDETVHKASTVTTFLDDEPEDKIKKDLLLGEVVVKGTMIVDVEKLEKELRRRLLS